MRAALPRLARSSFDDVLAAVGRGEMVSADVVRAVHPEIAEPRKAGVAPDKEAGWFGVDKAENFRFKVPTGSGSPPMRSIPIRGQPDNLPVSFAPGGAVPGDRIVGIRHDRASASRSTRSSRRSSWSSRIRIRGSTCAGTSIRTRRELFPAQIAVTAINEPGALAAITSAVSEQGGNIEDLRVVTRSPDLREILVDVQVWDLKQLNAIFGPDARPQEPLARRARQRMSRAP